MPSTVQGSKWKMETIGNKKIHFLEIIFLKVFAVKNPHSAEKGALSSQNFLKPRSFMKVKGYTLN